MVGDRGRPGCGSGYRLAGRHADQPGQGVESNEAIASYLRVAMAEAPVEVASSDRHTVKPWFAGRIDYAPPVHDLTAEGFPSDGGPARRRGSGRKVAVLVYRRNQHRVVLSLWPANAQGDVSARRSPSATGSRLAEWRHAGFDMRAVSDLSPADMTNGGQSRRRYRSVGLSDRTLTAMTESAQGRTTDPFVVVRRRHLPI